MERVLELLLPGEQLPYALAGWVPNTGAAIAEYTQAYGVGEAAPVRELLFDALWLHAVDLDDARVVHTIVVDDAIRSGATGSEPSPDGFHRVDAVVELNTNRMRHLRDRWTREWSDTGKQTVPVVVLDGADPPFGVDAVERLGTELLSRGADRCALTDTPG